MKRGEFPIQKDCSPKKPDEFAAWALVALPHMQGAALPMSSEYIQMVSKHLWDCGFRWHRKYQKIRWWPPSSGDPHWLTNPGRWKDITWKPDPADKEKQKANMVTVLKAMREADEEDFFGALDMVNQEGKQ